MQFSARRPVPMSSMGQDINEQMRSSQRQLSPTARDMNSSMRAAAPTASTGRPVPSIQPTTPVTMPDYRTPTGFKQTPTPVNPNPRPTAIPARPTSAPTVGMTPPRRPIGKLGALGVVAEGVNLADAAVNDRPGGIGGAALESGTRLGAAKIGAQLGARVPLPGVARAAAPVVGALAGYAGGQKAVDAVSGAVPDSVRRPVVGALDMADRFAGRNPGAMGLAGLTAVPAMVGGLIAGDRSTLTPARPAAPNFANVRTQVTTAVPQRPVAPPVPAAATPAAADENQIVGTFNGRTITRGEADQLAAKLPTSSGAPVAGPNGSVAYSTGGDAAGMVPARPTGLANSGVPATPTVRAPTADAYNLRQQEQLRREVMSGIDSQLFALRGRTNTRSARELAGELIRTQAGLANAGADTAAGVAGGDRDANLTANNANAQRAAQAQLQGMQNDAELERAGLQQAGETERTRIARRPTTPTENADGTMGFIDDSGVFSPVVDAQGRPQRAPPTRQTGGLAASDILSAYSQQFNAIQEGLGDAQAKQAAIDQLNSSPLGQRYTQTLGGQSDDQPPVAGAKRANDGAWYVQDPDGGFTKVTP